MKILKDSLKIGVSQIQNNCDVNQNLSTILECIGKHQNECCDIALFPECSLTGFTSRVKNTDFTLVETALRKIQAQVNEGKTVVFLPSAAKTESGEFLNSGYYFKPNSEIQQFFKEGLTESELKFFKTQKNNSRYFDVHGYKIGFLICIEAAHEAWMYLDSINKPDVILWPGYWGKDRDTVWSDSLTGDSLKIFQNNKSWKTNIVQATHFDNHENVGLGEGPFGKSMVINHQNELVYYAARREPEDFHVIFHKHKELPEIDGFKVKSYSKVSVV